MFVPCPHCQFLVAHHPQLRPLPADCPRCGRALQADGEPVASAESGLDTGPEHGSAATIDTAALLSDGRPLDDPASADNAAEAPAEGGVASESTGAANTATVEATPVVPGPAPAVTFASPGAPRRRAHWRWPLIVLLGLLLALQILLADRARLAEDPRWRPLVEAVCGTLGCALPPWHEPTAFTMLDRKVRPATHASGALRVDATFRNDARWSQAWPPLQLALSDADGRVLGSRVFLPQDYLGTAPATLLAPGQSAQITFVVQEPAPGTVAFSFQFR
ncbi:DUF3426 domain-containing protein [Pseudoxanthomonas daejeonensis]|uniref:DUF3426 domain-containing protein n=1 Tax=Pseudoxanthomonas daejeonensis TaxID=266062 RepID=A0ABQ6Z8G4_9GAMM|nr:DUF3426 domain-containing protein [Pseudoxanthomonas daejeonensis]KAF1695485.1 hypothetical protein CSC65_06895 [Pseudoxanthomonas daejeonensis]